MCNAYVCSATAIYKNLPTKENRFYICKRVCVYLSYQILTVLLIYATFEHNGQTMANSVTHQFVLLLFVINCDKCERWIVC